MPQQTTAGAGREWAAGWSHRIGDAIAHHRKAAGLTAAELAERCGELGYPVSRSLIAGIESGRKEAVTVAEVQVFARAIGVPPLLLLFPLGREHTTEALPGVEPPTWLEVRWWQGLYAPPVPVMDDDGNPTGEWAPRTILRDTALDRFHQHEHRVTGLEHARAQLRDIPGQPLAPRDREELLEFFHDSEQRGVEDLRTLRELMRREGLVPPPLPDGFLPGEPVEDVFVPAVWVNPPTPATVPPEWVNPPAGPTTDTQTGTPKGTTRKAHHA